MKQFADRSYYFFWELGFMHSVFTVTGEGVIVLDPISEQAARAYREAIASVTDQPVTHVVYSHDHLDHISGAEVLAPDAHIVGHSSIPGLLIARGHDHVPIPDIVVDSQHRIDLGSSTWDLMYLGPNHGCSNLAVVNADERWAVAVDVVTPGYVPYRAFPYVEIPTFLKTLDRLATLDIDLITDGHTPPTDAVWIEHYRSYMWDLIEATMRVRENLDERTVLASLPPGAGGVEMTEVMIGKTVERVVEQLRPQYGSWEGFERWAPLNVDRVVLYLITGA